MDDSSKRTVVVVKVWKAHEFTPEFHSVSYSPELLLENDPSKKFHLCCYREEKFSGPDLCVFILRVAIEVPWTCNGDSMIVGYNGKAAYGNVILDSGEGGLVDISLLQTYKSWASVEVSLTFYLDRESNKPPAGKNSLPMSCENVCDRLLTDDTKGPCTFVLKVEGKEIMVHGCVLAMQSEVFKRMVEQDGFREGREKVVEITDSDYDSVWAMVRFMHGFSSAARDHAEGVLPLADKYAVEPLKELAVGILRERIDLPEVVRIATLAFQHNVPTLFEECKEYIVENFREISATEEWKNLRDTNTELLVKLV